MHRLRNPLSFFLVGLFSLFLLGVFIKGAPGTVPNTLKYQKDYDKKSPGPFEGSNSSSRFALTQSFAEKNSVLFTSDLAELALPDLAYTHGKFFSIFTPGISFIGVPFYLLGKLFGLPQIVAYLSVTFFAFLNLFLVFVVARKLGTGFYASLLAGFLFLFATNELTYGVLYTQHATSVAFLLLSLLLIFGKPSLIKNTLFGVFVGIAFTLDIPNIIFLAPIGIYLFVQHLHVHPQHNETKITFDSRLFAVLFGIIPFIIFMAWYNFQTSGNYTRLPQSIGQVTTVDVKELAMRESFAATRSATLIRTLPFVSAVQVQGISVLLFGEERSLLVYQPIVLLGVFGLMLLYKRKKHLFIAHIITSIVLINIILYSLFDDPWGGWSFGPRYLIPASALLCIALAYAIDTYKNRLWFFLLFVVTGVYSVFVNNIGALTSSGVPTKRDALNINPHPFYTYMNNIDLLNKNDLGSLVYNVFFRQTQAWWFATGIILTTLFIICVLYFFAHRYDKKHNL